MILEWKTAAIAMLDLLLGWLLWLPRDASVALLGVISAVLGVSIRRLVCDRKLLGLIRQDERVLRRLIRQARRAGDQVLLARHRRVRTAVARLRLAVEIRALAVLSLPLAALVGWASARMEYLPVREGETVELRAWLPASSIGESIHLVPVEGLDATGGWIRSIEKSRIDGQARGRAEWRIRAAARASPYRLSIRFREQTLQQDLLVGQSTYLAPTKVHGEDIATELMLRRYAPLGIGWFDKIGVPPWLLAYVVATLSTFLVLGRAAPITPAPIRSAASRHT